MRPSTTLTERRPGDEVIGIIMPHDCVTDACAISSVMVICILLLLAKNKTSSSRCSR